MVVNFDTVAELSEAMEKEVRSNICFTVKSIKNHPDGGNKFMVGAEMKFINVCDFDVSRPEECRL